MNSSTSFQRSTSESSLRTAALLALAFFAGLAVRGLLTSNSSDRPRTNSPAYGTSADAVAEPGPRSYTDGIPSGFARSEDGAVAAAVSYVLTGQRLIELVPTRVPAAVRSMAASGSADPQIDEAEQQLRDLREVLTDGAGPTRYLQAVLASRVDAFTAERARVAVWSVGVLSRAGIAQPQAGWSIATFELVWERDDWKIWSQTITPGPAPSLNAAVEPASAEQLEQALLDFTPWSSGQ